MTLSQKETMLLEDLKSHEKLCVEKYSQYSSEASDGQLKNLFSQIGQIEQGHLNTIEQIMGGTVPAMNSSSGSSSSSSSSSSSGSQGSSSSQQQSAGTSSASSTYSSNASGKQRDQFLCSDLLSTEKHVSSVYDTCIFEFKDDQIRNVLNHIQKEEQQHGKQIYDFMSANGMYS